MRRRSLSLAAALAAVVVFSLSVGPGQAQSYDKVLAACTAAALKHKDEPDPTGFRCDWARLVKGAPGAALTGRFLPARRGSVGAMTIIERPGAPALIAISTVSGRAAHTCTVSVEAARDGDVLVARPPEPKGCVIRVRSAAKRNVVNVAYEGECHLFFCGMGAAFDGDWRLRGK